jgi:pilus assembly protein CpaF
LVSRLVLSSGAALDDAHPFVSFVLPNGLRVHTVISPICSTDLVLSIRKPAEQSLTLEQIRDLGTLSQSTLEQLRLILLRRENFLICGATGSGKTTLLRAMLNEVDITTRLLVLEDTPELKISRPNTVSLTTRANNADGIGGINLAHLVQESLRMRPDRIVVGEVRSVEVLDLLRAMNTGHAGSAGTIHANSAHDVPARLAALCQLGGVSLEAAHGLIGAAINVVIEVAMDAKRQRSVLNIARVGLNERQRIVLNFATYE